MTKRPGASTICIMGSELSHGIDLAVCVLTQNNMRTIAATLKSVRGIATRVIIVDAGSTDGTIEMCRSEGAEVIHRPWDGVTMQRQFALDECRGHAWVLALDSDESLDETLRESIRETIALDDPAKNGWMLNRKIWFLGDWLHHTFQPEWRLRLVRGGQGRVIGTGTDQRGTHERIVVQGDVGKLRGFCKHDSWADLADMSSRQVHYAETAALHDVRGGRTWNILINPIAAFVKQYILKRGFLDGPRGAIAAGAVASGTLLKHLYIAERRLKERCRRARGDVDDE